MAGPWPARVSLFFTGLTFTHYEFQYNCWSSTVLYPFQARATGVANPCCSSNTPVTHQDTPVVLSEFSFQGCTKILAGEEPSLFNSIWSPKHGFSKIGFPLCDVRCYQIKQRVEITWTQSYVRLVFLFIDQNFVYKRVKLPVDFSLQVNSMNPISSPPVIAFLFQTI